MKVSKEFYCLEEKKSYKKGDTYKGKRKDLSHLMEGKKEVKEDKASVDTKELKTDVKNK